jgi:hypothetical protein
MGFSWVIEENTTHDERTATITLKQINRCNKECKLILVQKGVENVYNFSNYTPSTTQNVGYETGSYNFYITSKKNDVFFDSFTISENCDWVTFSEKIKEENYYTLPFTITENTSTDKRSCTITATQSESNKTVTYTINQDGKVVVEKTDITVKFCGHYTEVMTENAIGRGCDRDGDGTYELFLPLSYVTDYYITYSIEGVTTVPNELQITVESNRYHLGKESRGHIEYTPISLSGTITVPECDETFNDQICTQIEQNCSPLIWGAYLTDESKYTLTVINRVNQECDESGGGGDDPEPEPEKKLVSEINVLNNCIGSINIEYTGPTGGKENKTLDAKSSEKFKLPMYGQTDVQISIPKESYNKDTSNFVFVSFLDENGYPLSIPSLETNVHAEGDGVKVTPIVTNMGSTETSVCATNTQYNVCATILYEAKG